MRSSARCVVFLLALGCASKEPAQNAPEPTQKVAEPAIAEEPFRLEEGRNPDLKPILEFAALMVRAGEPAIAGMTPVTVPEEILTDAGYWVSRRDFTGNMTGWLVSGDRLPVRVLFDDGLVRTFPNLKAGEVPEGESKPGLPRGLLPSKFERITGWIDRGHRFRIAFEGRTGAWQLAHFAAWHAQLKMDDEALEEWREAMAVLNTLPLEFPKASESDRMVLCAARSIAAASGNDETLAQQALERITAISREPLSGDVALEILKLLGRHAERIAEIAEQNKPRTVTERLARLRVELNKSEGSPFTDRNARLLEEAERVVAKHRREMEWARNNREEENETARIERMKARFVKAKEMEEQMKRAARELLMAAREEVTRQAWINEVGADPLLLPRSRQAEYWVRRLPVWRSVTLQSRGIGTFIDSLAHDEKDPCQRLLALGDEALPTLVATACNPLQTWTDVEGTRLTVGDVCAFLIEQLTGEAPLPHADGSSWPGLGLDDEKREKAIAAWWKELEPLSAEDRWVVLWKRGSRQAMDALIRIDARRHLPAIVERAEATPGRQRGAETRRVIEALRRLPVATLQDLETTLPESCREVVREALR